jgi:hypothetical protein
LIFEKEQDERISPIAAQKESSDLIVQKILTLDPDNIIGCYIVRIGDSVVLSDYVRTEYRSFVKPFSHTGAGMASKWGLMGLTASKRMDGERGRTKYLVAAREKFVTLLFLHPRNPDLEIGIMLSPDAQPSKIYEKAVQEL